MKLNTLQYNTARNVECITGYLWIEYNTTDPGEYKEKLETTLKAISLFLGDRSSLTHQSPFVQNPKYSSLDKAQVIVIDHRSITKLMTIYAADPGLRETPSASRTSTCEGSLW